MWNFLWEWWLTWIWIEWFNLNQQYWFHCNVRWDRLVYMLSYMIVFGEFTKIQYKIYLWDRPGEKSVLENIHNIHRDTWKTNALITTNQYQNWIFSWGSSYRYHSHVNRWYFYCVSSCSFILVSKKAHKLIISMKVLN